MLLRNVFKFYRQKLVRLQHENTMLKMNQKEPEEDKISVLQTLLDSTRQQYNELRLNNRYNCIIFILL